MRRQTTAVSTAAVVEEKVRIGQRVCIINPTDDDVGMEGTVVHCEAGLYKDGILVRFADIRTAPSSARVLPSSSRALVPRRRHLAYFRYRKRIRLLKWEDGFTVEDVTTAIPMSAQDEACAIKRRIYHCASIPRMKSS